LLSAALASRPPSFPTRRSSDLRVAIARALVRRPDLLLLDEPMAGVDTPTQDTLVALLGRLHREGMTIVVVLHEVAGMSAILQRRSEEHTSELQSRFDLVCRLLL